VSGETDHIASTTDAASVLRRAREGREESLLQAAESTRISVVYLEALEQNASIESFPSPLYARFFLREYAQHLGLDEDRLLSEFSRRHGLANQPPPPAADLRFPGERVSRLSSRILPPPRIGSRSRVRRLFGGSRPVRRTSLPPLPAHVPVSLSPARRVRSRPRIGRIPPMILVIAAVLPLIAVLYRSPILRALSGQEAATPAPSPVSSPEPPPELPRGGRLIFPDYRVVAFYGAARTDRLGILGIGPDLALERLLKQADAYERPGRPVLPAFELIATVASGHPGEDGMYRMRHDDFLIGGYLDAAREAKILFVLDIQPGRSDFMTEVKVYEKYLRQPDVGLAIDPEWHVGPGQVPGKHLGSTDAATINRVSAYLAGIVRRYNLPEKLFIVHQFTLDMIKNKGDIKIRPGLATVIDVDGFGNRPTKISKYRALTKGFRKKFHHGIKLYYERDTNLMTPRAVLRLKPQPEVIIYQ